MYLRAFSSAVSTKNSFAKTISWNAKKRISVVPIQFIFSFYATEKTDTANHDCLKVNFAARD